MIDTIAPRPPRDGEDAGYPIDLAGYPDHAGGLEQSATVLSELAENMSPDMLAAAARTAPIPWVQRLGYLLELAEAKNITGPLKDHVHEHARGYVLLAPAGETDGERIPDWKLIVNESVEPEF